MAKTMAMNIDAKHFIAYLVVGSFSLVALVRSLPLDASMCMLDPSSSFCSLPSSLLPLPSLSWPPFPSVGGGVVVSWSSSSGRFFVLVLVAFLLRGRSSVMERGPELSSSVVERGPDSSSSVPERGPESALTFPGWEALVFFFFSPFSSSPSGSLSYFSS